MRAHFLLLSGVVAALQPLQETALSAADTVGLDRQQAADQRDAQHDFDFEIGTWNTRLSRRLNPLTGSSAWVEYVGTTVVWKVWDGRANLVELDVKGSAGRIEGLSLRLYNPQSRRGVSTFPTAPAAR